MSEPSIASNALNINTLQGEVKTLKAEIKGQMQVQSTNIKHMKESSERTEKSVDRLAKHVDKLFETCDDHGKSISGMEQRISGHETLCIQRDNAIHIQIDSGFKAIEDKLTTDKNNAKDEDSNKKWRVGLYITIIIAGAGWLIAALR